VSKRRQNKLIDAGNQRPPLRPKTQKQADYLHALQTADAVVVLGPAGTGKTYVAATYTADRLADGAIDKIIITRPNVPAGRDIGFLPGDLKEKMEPYAASFLTPMRERLGKQQFDSAMRGGKIEIVPFATMRGRSFSDALIILDEAQNATLPEMKMFLTRQGEGSQIVVNGDISQSDLPGDSGLKTVLQLIKKHNMQIPIIEFGLDDIVRSNLCAAWCRAFFMENL
jgi:phosphate starvation-inducible PhoH-like protein